MSSLRSAKTLKQLSIDYLMLQDEKFFQSEVMKSIPVTLKHVLIDSKQKRMARERLKKSRVYREKKKLLNDLKTLMWNVPFQNHPGLVNQFLDLVNLINCME